MRDLTLAQLNGPAQKSKKKNEKTEKVIINAFEKVSHRWPYSSETAFAVVDDFKEVPLIIIIKFEIKTKK